MNDKLKAMYKSGGLLKALLKDPAQRKMAEGMLKNMAMGGKMDYGMGGTMKYRAGGKAMYQNGGGPTGKKDGEYTKYTTDVVPSRANFEEAIRQEFALGQGTMPKTAEELIALGAMEAGDLARVRSRAEQIASDDFNSRMRGAQGKSRSHSRDIAAGMAPQEKEAYMKKLYDRPDTAEARLRDEYGDRIIEQAYVTTDDPQGRYLQSEVDSFNEVQRIKKEREDAILREMGLL